MREGRRDGGRKGELWSRGMVGPARADAGKTIELRLKLVDVPRHLTRLRSTEGGAVKDRCHFPSPAPAPSP